MAVLQSLTFESGDWKPDWSGVQLDKARPVADQFKVIDHPYGPWKKAALLHSFPDTQRVEVVKFDLAKPGAEQWISFHVELPDGFHPDDETEWGILAQVKDNYPGGQPLFSLRVDSRGPIDFLEAMCYGGGTVTNGVPSGFRTSGSLHVGGLELNVVQEFLMHSYWHDKAGWLELYFQGERVFTWTGPTLYTGSTGAYWKQGFYSAVGGSECEVIVLPVLVGATRADVEVATVPDLNAQKLAELGVRLDDLESRLAAAKAAL